MLAWRRDGYRWVVDLDSTNPRAPLAPAIEVFSSLAGGHSWSFKFILPDGLLVVAGGSFASEQDAKRAALASALDRFGPAHASELQALLDAT